MLERLQTESREVNHQAHQSPQLDRFAAYKTVGSKLEDEDARSCSSGVTAAKISEGGGARGESGRLLTPKDFPFVGSKRASDSGSRAGASPPRSSQVVGWPPFGYHRMNSLVNNQATKSAREEGEEAGKKKDDETKGILVTQVLRNNQKLD